MFGRKTRQIRTLQARVETLVEQRDTARRDHASAIFVNDLLARRADKAAAHANRSALAWTRVVKDANLAEGLFARAMNVVRTRDTRHAAQLARLRAELGARGETARQRQRADALALRVEMLQQANQKVDWQSAVQPKAVA